MNEPAQDSASLTVVLISGSIAASNAAGLISIVRERLGGPVIAVLTKGGAQFVAVDTLRYAGGAAAVVTDTSIPLSNQPDHIWLATQASHILVYPASANFIATLAAGLADDTASLVFLASHDKPRMLVPSMNPMMWSNPMVQRNIAELQKYGVRIVPTANGIAPDLDTVVSRFREFVDTQMCLLREEGTE